MFTKQQNNNINKNEIIQFRLFTNYNFFFMKKQQDQKGVKELIVLDPKRSNVINIGMTKLPPPRTIKTAILKMDSSIINREGIEVTKSCITNSISALFLIHTK